MKKNIKNIKDIKKFVFDGQFKKFPYLNKFTKNPYTFLKARYYMYSSVFLIYFLLKSKITPNMVTISYAFCGLIGGIFLMIPNYYCNFVGIFIFFNKGILDWSDGYLARIKYKITLKGHILDVYGAYLNSLCFNIGLGFFVFNQTGYDFLIYIIVTIGFLYGGLPSLIGKQLIIDELREIKISDVIINHNIDHDTKKKFTNNKKYKYPSWIKYFKGFLDDRARSVDFILLFIVIDIFYKYNISFYIFLALFVRNLLKFLILFTRDLKSNWPEKIIINIKNTNYGKK